MVGERVYNTGVLELQGLMMVMLNQRHKFIVPLLFYFTVPIFIFAMLFMRLPGDSMLWREFQFESLTFVIHSVQPNPFQLVLRIHDRLHNQEHADRFNRSLLVMQGENRFRIPLAEIRNAPVGREMDMTRITGVTYLPLTLFSLSTST